MHTTSAPLVDSLHPHLIKKLIKGGDPEVVYHLTHGLVLVFGGIFCLSGQDKHHCLAIYDWKEAKLLFTARTTTVCRR